MTWAHASGAALVAVGLVAVLALGYVLLLVVHRLHPPDPRPRSRSALIPYDEVQRQRLAREDRRRQERRAARENRRNEE